MLPALPAPKEIRNFTSGRGKVRKSALNLKKTRTDVQVFLTVRELLYTDKLDMAFRLGRHCVQGLSINVGYALAIIAACLLSEIEQ